MGAVVLVGSDPVGDFPDRALAEEALGSAGFVVAVDGFLSPSAALADVVLPVAIAHERTGTTTNIEGRVTRLAQKLVAPGQCWPDWMVAAELADRLERGPRCLERGRALGRDRAAGSLARRDHPGRARHPRRTRRDRRPAAGVAGADHEREVRLAPFDPMATPGIDAVEVQGAPPRAGLAEPPGGDELLELGATAHRAPTATRRRGPGRCAGPCPSRRRTSPPSTATRCGSCRRGGSTTTACCSRRVGPSPRWRRRRRCGPIPTTSGSWASRPRQRVRVRSSRGRPGLRGRRRRRCAPRRGQHRLQPPRGRRRRWRRRHGTAPSDTGGGTVPAAPRR